VEGSDGRAYKQVTKMAPSASSDDTRQDAVMQQLFGLVNRFLARDGGPGAARARRLRVRTYKVVPLTPVRSRRRGGGEERG